MKRKKFNWGNFIIGTILILFALAVFYPFYISLLNSFMTEAEAMRRPFALYVKDWNFDAYIEIFTNGRIVSGYKASLIIVGISVPLSMLLSTSLGYALSRKKFLFSKTINNMIVFTMYFGGGLIPSYLLIKNFGLMNSYWAIILPHAVTTYNLILIKNYFYTIPDELEESAKIDGANDIVIYARIYMPLAKPILATVGLFYTVSKWNEWYNPMLYLRSGNKWPVSLVLRDIIINVRDITEDASVEGDIFSKNIKMASIVAAMLPVMLVYPFLQKYFMKGILVGAVKS